MRKIAIYDSFTEPKHRRLIDETAARAGFTVDYYAAPAAVPADKRGDYEVIYGMPKPGELKDFVNLKWFCGSFAGVDAYLDDSLYPSPEVMLSNSSGAYGVTIAEHMVMVTLMLLRHAPSTAPTRLPAAGAGCSPCAPLWAAPSPSSAPAISAPSSPAAPRPWVLPPSAVSAAPKGRRPRL